MGAENTLSLSIEIDTSQGKQAVDQMNTSLNVFERQAVTSSGRASAGLNQFEASAKQSGEQMRHATRAAEMLGSRFGVQLPEGARMWMASLKGLGPLLASAFSATAVIAIGMALFDAGRKLYDWATATKLAKDGSDSLNKSLLDQSRALAKLREEYEMMGLSEAGKAGKSLGKAKEWLADNQGILADYEKERARLEGVAAQTSWGYRGPRMTREAEAAKVSLAGTNELIREQQAIINTASQNVLNLQAGYDKTFSDEGSKRLGEERRQLEALRSTALSSWDAMIQGHKNRAAADAQIIRDTALEEKKVHDEALSSWDALIAQKLQGQTQAVEAIKKEVAAVGELTKTNEQLNLSILKRYGTSQEVLQFELDALEQEKILYAGNADAIAAIEEKKKLLIQQNNLDIAQDSRNQFEKTAQTIEGFFNRVFMSAKSFGDIWKNLWKEIVSSIVSQFSRMAASWLSSRFQMGQGSGSGGGSSGESGIWNFLKSAPNWISKIWGGGGNTSSPQSMGSQSTGYDLNSLPGWGGWGGPGASSSSSNVASVATDSVSFAQGAGSSFASGQLPGLIAYLGAQQTQKLFYPAIQNSKATLGNYFKADFIGPGGGLPIATVFNALHKTALEKARETIQQTYGLDIREDSILKPIVAAAQKIYGGDVRRAVSESQEIRDLVELYAMSTGQKTDRMPGKMTSASFYQSGGSLYSASSSGMSSLPGSGLGSSSGSGGSGGSSSRGLVIRLDGAATTALLRGEAVQAIDNNPRRVQASTMRATRSNYNRRELTSLQLSPGTLTS